MPNPLDVPAKWEDCYTAQNTLIYENGRGLNHMEFDITASRVTIRAGSVLETSGILLKAVNDEDVSISASSVALAINSDDGNVTPLTSFAGYKYDPLRRGVYKGNSRLFHTLVKRVAGTSGFTGTTITGGNTTKFWVSKGIHVFYIRGGRGADGGLGGTDSNYAGGIGAQGAVFRFVHFETKGQWAIAICGYDGMPPLAVKDGAWVKTQPNNDAGGGGACSGNASIVLLEDGTFYYALGGSGGGGIDQGSGSKGGAGVIRDAGTAGAGGGGGVGSNDIGGGNGGDIKSVQDTDDSAGGGGNGGKRSASSDGKPSAAGDGGLGPGAGGGSAFPSESSQSGFGGDGSHGSGGLKAAPNRIENWSILNGKNGFPSPSADPSWWDLSSADLASQYYALYAGGGAGGSDGNDERAGINGGTMIWSASAWLSRSGSQVVSDYQVS
jgi:hypothetical protein